ncbi:hypothetical protein NLJ89_g602 [Agrocybe chaxingu]|uniref:DUF6534 domain-containing protein n=1 Tax=Agrocybe chaxingu TaxID=84603 RepID=A0A9W8TFU8_9AGAR|nr:hypothetical protein NLJ89_g602 [Agrocybe chaxingu]
MSDHVGGSDRGLGAPFLGYSIGCLLFGITALQAYQYFTNYPKDSRMRKRFTLFICSLDLAHLVIGAYMLYNILIYYGCETNPEQRVVGVFKTATVVSVQAFYTSQIWKSAAAAFLLYLLKLRLLHSFTPSEKVLVPNFALKSVFSNALTILGQIVIFLGLGSAAFVDFVLGSMMALIVYSSRGEATQRGADIVTFLVLFFVGTGLLTAVAHLVLIALYASQPRNLLYMGMEFCITRLYTNSVLALFNSKKRLTEKLESPIEPSLPSSILFGGREETQ